MDSEGGEKFDGNGETNHTEGNSNSNSKERGESEQADEVGQVLKGPDLVMALEIVEKDANEVAGSLTFLLSSLRLALSQVTSSSVEHMRCYNDVAGQLQESTLDAASKGNRFINASLRLNDEMKGAGNIAAQLKSLRRTVDHLDSLVTRYLPRA